MAQAKTTLEALIATMSKLPGLGKRSAQRAVLEMIKRREHLMLPLLAQLPCMRQY
jgi:recombination protein RecR